ncbi:unnamed protein product [Pylaiella littoralis]
MQAQAVAEHLHQEQQLLQQQQQQQQRLHPEGMTGSGGGQGRVSSAPPAQLQQQQQQQQHNRRSSPEWRDKGGGAAGGALPASLAGQQVDEKDKAKSGRFPPKRTVKNQFGLLYLAYPNGAGGGPQRVRPSAHLTVRWELPAGCIDGIGRPRRELGGGAEPQRLMVGLFRLGVGSNTAGIISKKMFERPPRGVREPREMLVGTVPFYAPKSVGLFVFRIYDANDPVDTLATSHAWQVDAQGRDVELSLRFVLNQLRSTDGKGSVMGALAQLAHLLGHLQTAPPQRYNRSVGSALWNAVLSARNQLGGVKLNSSGSALGNGGAGKNGGNGGGSARGGRQATHDKDAAADDRKLRAVHGAVWCVLNAIVKNPAAGALLADAPPQMDPFNKKGTSLPCVAVCKLWQSTFCSFEERYFDTPQALAKHHRDDFGFTPSKARVEDIDQTVLLSLADQMSALLPQLLPSADFEDKRERVRVSLERSLMKQLPEMIPKGSTLRVFGSSINGFGNDGADLDMCIEYANGNQQPEDSGALIESIAGKLKAAGMTEVDSRPTARIPIVIFKDTGSGLECDISVMNPLAVRNTRLLKAYSVADPRVKELAYVVKHWAKRRWINNASEGTLSSYGYLLCLVHFLQTRSPPVVPNLQALPPDWAGETPPGFPDFNLPTIVTKQPTDGSDYNTYFYDPLTPGRDGKCRTAVLREFGARNTASSGELLAEFFRYFALDLDCRASVVSVRLGCLVDRERKAEACCWSMHTRLSLEDPFETWYDVAHVLKWSQFKHVRMEFARAYELLARSASSSSSFLLEKICTQADPPPFTKTEERAAHERAEEEAEQLRLLHPDTHAL